MSYSLMHLLVQIWSYILRLIQPPEKVSVSELNEGKIEQVAEAAPVPVEKESSVFIGELLRFVTPHTYVDIYSSDKSLMKGPVYGGDVLEYASHVSSVADALLLDKTFAHDDLVRKRAELYVRDIFVGMDQNRIDPVQGIRSLKNEAIRLSDGLALRDKHPQLGIHTYQNSITARMLLRDLDEFFKESNFDYQEHRTNRGGRVHFRES